MKIKEQKAFSKLLSDTNLRDDDDGDDDDDDDDYNDNDDSCSYPHFLSSNPKSQSSFSDPFPPFSPSLASKHAQNSSFSCQMNIYIS